MAGRQATSLASSRKLMEIARLYIIAHAVYALAYG
jgi:hypothetical protein